MDPQVKISVTKSSFMKEAVLAACCDLSSDTKSYLVQKSADGKFLDVMITLGAVDTSDAIVKGIAEEFKEVLYEKQLQVSLIKNNMKACEEITYNALSNPAVFKESEPEEALPDSIAKIIEESSGQGEESYLDDVLKIAVPWEEKDK